MGIELTYVNWDKTFPSKTALYRHLKTYTYLRHIALVLNATPAPIQVIEFIIWLVSLSTNFGFRG